MSEQEAVAAPETADVSDAQVDAFFESGGEVAEAQAEPEQAAQSEPEAEPAKAEPEKQDKTVPYGALHEERMRRKELQEQVQQNTARTQQMEEAFQKILERSQAEQVPSYDESPLEALRYQNEQLQQRLSHYDQRFQQDDAQRQAYAQQQRFVSDYQQAAQEFTQETPEFTDAYRHLVDTRQSELVSIGYSPQEAAQMLVQEEAMIVGKAMQDGVNPAGRIYELAKMRGYAGKPAEAQKGQDPDVAKMDALEKGAKAAQTLSGSGGQTKEGVTLEALASLSDEDFDKAWEKLIGPGY